MQKFWEIPILGNMKTMEAEAKSFMFDCNLITVDKPEMASCQACMLDVFHDFEIICSHVETLDHLNNLVHKLQTNLNRIKAIPKSPMDKRYLDIHKMIMYKTNAVFCHICNEKIKLCKDMDFTASAERHIMTSPPHIEYIFNFINRIHEADDSDPCNDLARRKQLSDKYNVSSLRFDRNVEWPQDYAPYARRPSRVGCPGIIFNGEPDFITIGNRNPPPFNRFIPFLYPYINDLEE